MSADRECPNCARLGRTCPAHIAEKLKVSTPPPPAPDPVSEALCVSCSQPAHEHNSRLDPPSLYVGPKWAVCDGCVPSDAVLTDEMEPEEVAILCWHSMLVSGNRPSEEVAELLMSWTARERATVLAALRDAGTGEEER